MNNNEKIEKVPKRLENPAIQADGCSAFALVFFALIGLLSCLKYLAKFLP